MTDFTKAQPQQTPKTLGTKPSESTLNEAILAAHTKEAEAKNAVAQSLKNFAALPAEGVGALFGAPQRVIASRLAHMAANPRGVAETSTAPLFGGLPALLDPRGREQLGNEAYAVFHPNDPSIQSNAEKAVGVDKLRSNDPRFRGKLQNFAVDTGFENLTDPLNWATLGTAAGGEIALRGIGKIGTRSITSNNPLIRSTARHLATNVEERAGGFTPEEIAKINSVKQAQITRTRVQHSTDAQLLSQNRTLLKKGIMPEAIRQRLLQEAYVEGTPEMREQAQAFGYRPTGSEQSKAPTGMVNYNLREHYDPHTGAFDTPHNFDDLLTGELEDLRPPGAGFEKQQTGVADPGTLYDRVERRLAQGRGVVRHRTTVENLQTKAGLSPEMANATATRTKVGGFEPAKALSRAQVDALLTTGLPHMRNVGVAGYLAGGEAGVAQAMRYFLSGIPKKTLDRLNEGGASHFGVRVPGDLSPARLIPPGIRKASTGMLDRWDQALRAARLEQVDKEMKGADELVKLDRVNQDLGAYNLKPHYVDVLQNFLGANFPQWHNYIVPTVVGRAALRAPGRISRLGRAEQNANDTFLPNAPYRVTLGGPVDEAASAVADPARLAFGETPGKRYPSYFGGPSSVGVLAPIARQVLYGGKKEIPQFISGLIPFGGVGLDVFANPFNSPLPPAARAAAGVSGIYTQKRPPSSMARTAAAAPSPTPLPPPTGGGTDFTKP